MAAAAIRSRWAVHSRRMWPRPAHFIILFFGRTGSTVLVEELRRQRRVRADYEILAECKAQGPEAQLERARRCYAGSLRPLRAAGFKTKLWDVLDPEGLAAVLREAEARVIHMRRDNVVKGAISTINADRLRERTGQWTMYREEHRPEPFAVDIGRLRSWIASREEGDERIRAYIRDLDLPSMELTYEDLVGRPGDAVERLGEFLGVRLRPPALDRAQSKKVTPDDLRNILTNYDAVAAALRGTPYEPMLTERIGVS